MAACYTTNVLPGCFNGTPVIIHVTEDSLGAPATRIIDVSGNIVVGATDANTTPGPCTAVTGTAAIQANGLNIASGSFVPLYDPHGFGTVWNYTGTRQLQSVTVSATQAGAPGSGNYVKLVFASGSELYLIKGQTMTWSVAQDTGMVGEFLDPNTGVECAGNSACSILWTEQL